MFRRIFKKQQKKPVSISSVDCIRDIQMIAEELSESVKHLSSGTSPSPSALGVSATEAPCRKDSGHGRPPSPSQSIFDIARQFDIAQEAKRKAEAERQRQRDLFFPAVLVAEQTRLCNQDNLRMLRSFLQNRHHSKRSDVSSLRHKQKHRRQKWRPRQRRC